MGINTKLKIDNSKFCQGTGDSINLSGVTNVGTAEYLTCKHSEYTNRSLVDKEYVDGIGTGSTSGANAYTDTCTAACSVADNAYTDACTLACTVTASNGLTKTLQAFCLGGAITQDTDLTGSYKFGVHTNIVNVTGDTSVNLGGTVALKTTPATGTGDVLTYNATTGAIQKTDLTGLGGITGATNGLGLTGQDVCLGGALTNATTISGAEVFTIGTENNICLATTTTKNIGLNAKSNGEIYLKSQSGVVDGNDMTNAVGIELDFNATIPMLVTDNTGASPRGLQYASDYSQTFCDNSLVTKYYVDSIATGLNVHGAVDAATTADHSLVGLGGDIDGSPISGFTLNRVLVKNQTDASENGIYTPTAGVWTRTDDYNFSPAGEISNGDLIPVVSGDTQANSQWINVSDNPIESGDDINFSLFAQQQGIVEGDGICVTTSGANREVGVKLSPSNAGLCFDATALELDYSTFTCGLDTSTTGEVRVNASQVGATGTEIPVLIGTGNALFVDSDDFSYTSAANGLTKVGCNVQLGGALTTGTTVSMAGTTSLTFTDTRAAKCGIEYGGDYENDFIDRSLVTKQYVDGNVASGGTSSNAYTDTCTAACSVADNAYTDTCVENLTANNGITRSDDDFKLGGVITGDTCILLPIVGASNATTLHIGNEASEGAAEAYITVVNGDNGGVWLGHGDLNSGISANCYSAAIMSTTKCIEVASDYIQICDDTTNTGISFTGNSLTYDGDYEDDFVDRSLITKQYLSTQLFGSGATNGLSVSGENIVLGGVMTGDTTLRGDRDLGGGDRVGLNFNYFNSFSVLADNHTFTSGNFCFCGSYAEFTTNEFKIRKSSLVGTTFSGCTVEYFANQHVNYTDRSLVDKEYVDSTATSAATGATASIGGANGLTRVDDNIELGGIVTKNTCVQLPIIGSGTTTSLTIGDNTCTEARISIENGDTGTISLNDGDIAVIVDTDTVEITAACCGAVYAGDYEANFVARSLITKQYVDGEIATGTTNLSADNGLTITNDTVELGGTLTKETYITGTTNNRLVLGDNTNSMLVLNSDGDLTLPNVFLSSGDPFGDPNSVSMFLDKYTAQGLFGSLMGGIGVALDITGGTVNITAPSIELEGTVTLSSVASGAGTDNLLVIDGSGVVKEVAQSSVGITTASNGLSVDGSNFVLGGEITGNTCVDTCDFGIAISYNSLATGANVAIIGGHYNGSYYGCNKGADSGIFGGYYNSSYGNCSVVIGGVRNTTGYYQDNSRGENSVIVGGQYNFTYGTNTAILGGCGNGVYNNNAAVVGGSGNDAYGDSSVVLGGKDNRNDSYCGGIIGGEGNTNCSNNSVIIGGTGMTVTDSLPNHAIVPNLAIWNTPDTGSNTDLVLVWDDTDKKVKSIEAGSLGENNNEYNIDVVSGNTTLPTSGYTILVNSPTSSVTLTLPTGVDKMAYKIKDAAGEALTYPITIIGDVDGSGNAIINTDYGALELVYSSELSGWFSMAFIN